MGYRFSAARWSALVKHQRVLLARRGVHPAGLRDVVVRVDLGFASLGGRRIAERRRGLPRLRRQRAKRRGRLTVRLGRGAGP